MKDSRTIIRQLVLTPISILALCAGSFVVAQTASTTYRGAKQDPFTKYRPPMKRAAIKNSSAPVAPPSIASRIENYKAQKAAAMNLRQPVPKPTTALLVSEVQVTGIFRTPRGVAATVEAMPIRLSYVIYPGEAFYDGMLVAVEDSQLVFRREVRWSDGRRELVVDNKPLRQPNAYTDSLSTQKSEADAGAKSDRPAAQAAAAESSEPKDASSNANAKAVESLNNKVDKLLDLLKKQ